MTTHGYATALTWTGNRGTGTSCYRAYGRSYRIDIPGKPSLTGSADAAFLGDPSFHNPEDLLLAALSACHMLWYLHLAADSGLRITEYQDHAEAWMVIDAEGGGRFTEARLHPLVTVEHGSPGRDEDPEHLATVLHAEAHARCFIARSVAFPVRHVPTARRGPAPREEDA